MGGTELIVSAQRADVFGPRAALAAGSCRATKVSRVVRSSVSTGSFASDGGEAAWRHCTTARDGPSGPKGQPY